MTSTNVVVPAFATLGAALVAILGSLLVLELNLRASRRGQAREHREAQDTQRRQWDREEALAARQAELTAIRDYDVAITMIIHRFETAQALITHPLRRRAVWGRQWRQEWTARLEETLKLLLVPDATVRLQGRSELLLAVDAVNNAAASYAKAFGSIPKLLLPWPFTSAGLKKWHHKVLVTRHELGAQRLALRELVRSP